MLEFQDADGNWQKAPDGQWVTVIRGKSSPIVINGSPATNGDGIMNVVASEPRPLGIIPTPPGFTLDMLPDMVVGPTFHVATDASAPTDLAARVRVIRMLEGMEKNLEVTITELPPSPLGMDYAEARKHMLSVTPMTIVPPETPEQKAAFEKAWNAAHRGPKDAGVLLDETGTGCLAISGTPTMVVFRDSEMEWNESDEPTIIGKDGE